MTDTTAVKPHAYQGEHKHVELHGGVGDDNAAPKQENEITVMEDHSHALQAALAADPGIPVGSLRFAKFTLMMLCVCLCGGDTGERWPTCA